MRLVIRIFFFFSFSFLFSCSIWNTHSVWHMFGNFYFSLFNSYWNTIYNFLKVFFRFCCCCCCQSSQKLYKWEIEMERKWYFSKKNYAITNNIIESISEWQWKMMMVVEKKKLELMMMMELNFKPFIEKKEGGGGGGVFSFGYKRKS